MSQRITPGTALLLTLPPLMWAGNAVVGSLVGGAVPPMTLNFLRWVLAFVMLLPLAGWVLRPGSGLWSHLPRFALLGFLGIGSYNALQYLALHTSTPINVTLVAASTPVWMVAMGWLFFGQKLQWRQGVGAALSIAGVVLVLSRGSWETLMAVRLVRGDFYVLLATVAWAWYSWLLTQPDKEPRAIRSDWAAFVLAQCVPGLVWAGAFSAAEWTWTDARIDWSWTVVLALLYVGAGPAVLAYRCWTLGIQRVGPAVASFFANLTPLFAAVFSAAFLGEPPRLFHALAFVMIVGGIWASSRR